MATTVDATQLTWGIWTSDGVPCRAVGYSLDLVDGFWQCRREDGTVECAFPSSDVRAVRLLSPEEAERLFSDG